MDAPANVCVGCSGGRRASTAGRRSRGKAAWGIICHVAQQQSYCNYCTERGACRPDGNRAWHGAGTRRSCCAGPPAKQAAGAGQGMGGAGLGNTVLRIHLCCKEAFGIIGRSSMLMLGCAWGTEGRLGRGGACRPGMPALCLLYKSAGVRLQDTDQIKPLKRLAAGEPVQKHANAVSRRAGRTAAC
jgi:hypothetical protein